jgi:hypothetical protein
MRSACSGSCLVSAVMLTPWASLITSLPRTSVRALLVTVSGNPTRAAARHAAAAPAMAQAHQAAVHGMASSFTMATVFDAAALLLVVLVPRTRRAIQPAAAAVSE